MRKKEILAIGYLAWYAFVTVLLMCFAGYTIYIDMLDKHNQQIEPIENASVDHSIFALFFLVLAVLAAHLFISKFSEFRNSKKEHHL